MSSTETPPRLLTPGEAAGICGLSVGRLAKLRCTRSDAIPFVRIGRSIRYRQSDLAGFIDRSLHRSTSDYAASDRAEGSP